VSKLLFVATDYKPRPGGIAEYVDNLARGLIDLGHSVSVLGVVRESDKDRIAFLNTYENWVRPFPMSYDERPAHRLGSLFVSLLEIIRCEVPWMRRLLDRTRFFRPSAEAVSRFERLLAAENPDFVMFGHLDIDIYPFALALLERRVPYGIIAHDVEISRRDGRINDRVRTGMMLKNASLIAANSRHTRGLIEKWKLPSAKLAVIHPPIAGKAIQQSAQSAERPRMQNNRLITIARLVPGKGIDIVLRALTILDQQNIPFHYVIAGDGPERNRLEALAGELGIRERVQFLGSITNEAKWSLLREAAVFVMPSRVNPKLQHEGFGLAFIEAAAFGLPGIGSRGGGIPEAVIHGETGLVVSEESPMELADALRSLFTDSEARRRMGIAGMERARRYFSPVAVASQFHSEILKRMPRSVKFDVHPEPYAGGEERVEHTVRTGSA
jgi:phosphatidylinositol alpha-1,6-mannosyltransferase